MQIFVSTNILIFLLNYFYELNILYNTYCDHATLNKTFEDLASHCTTYSRSLSQSSNF